ncbi:hypothetical protein [Poseidonocella sp. HB161398]|uniref:hypothetical protein n=1 Tax=Poseidonocella sp. HB161398 TaxID=2320855 RepID=UPI0011097A48|nr:hypothetical protein [Poseidonocella sp. HB161398]
MASLRDLNVKDQHDVWLNLIYTPRPDLDIGLECVWGRRTVYEAPAAGISDSGEAQRVQLSLQYKF